jgi:hypothetical protein
MCNEAAVWQRLFVLHASTFMEIAMLTAALNRPLPSLPRIDFLLGDGLSPPSMSTNLARQPSQGGGGPQRQRNLAPILPPANTRLISVPRSSGASIARANRVPVSPTSSFFNAGNVLLAVSDKVKPGTINVREARIVGLNPSFNSEDWMKAKISSMGYDGGTASSAEIIPGYTMGDSRNLQRLKAEHEKQYGNSGEASLGSRRSQQAIAQALTKFDQVLVKDLNRATIQTGDGVIINLEALQKQQDDYKRNQENNKKRGCSIYAVGNRYQIGQQPRDQVALAVKVEAFNPAGDPRGVPTVEGAVKLKPENKLLWKAVEKNSNVFSTTVTTVLSPVDQRKSVIGEATGSCYWPDGFVMKATPVPPNEANTTGMRGMAIGPGGKVVFPRL